MHDALRMLAGRRLAVLTGAGISTESGIPDYRGPLTRAKARNPILGQSFRSCAETRRRYWARSLVGWPRIAQAQPNPAHRALARLEAAGRLVGIITQNVDGLHGAAGSREVVELHGNLSQVLCLGCGGLGDRGWLQQRLTQANPGWVHHPAESAPDGDAELSPDAGFRVVACPACGGVLKPWVVFFGEGVPRERVDRAFALLDAAEALLVIGSSLAVYSGFRFARAAHRQGKPLVLLNLGETRADPLADLKLEARAGVLLPQLVEGLLA